MAGITEIKRQYIELPVASGLARQRLVLEKSFALAAAQRELLGDAYDTLQVLYTDAMTVLDAAGLDLDERQALLYPIYEGYFRQLSVLPWKKRKPLQADKMIKAMKKCLKQGAPQSASLQYWMTFAVTLLPLLIVMVAGEVIWLDLRGTGAPLWQTALAFIAFVGGFTGYFYVSYHIEGRRLFGDLQKWIQYRQNPMGHNKPVGLVQVAKLVLPPLATIVAALLKIFF